MVTRSNFYYAADFHRDANLTQTLVPSVNSLPLAQFVADPAMILESANGDLIQGMYAYDGAQWRFALPTEAISEGIINGSAMSIYYNLTDTVTTLPVRAKVYKNGQLQPNDIIIPGNAIYVVMIPPATGGTAAVTSVNGGVGDVVVDASNLPGLSAVGISGQYNDLLGVPTPFTLTPATGTAIGGVIVPTAGNLVIDSLGNVDIKPAVITLLNSKSTVTQVGNGEAVIDSSVSGDVKLRSIKAGANVTITNDTAGNLVVASTASSDTELTGDITGIGSGTIVTTLSDTGVVAGAYTKVTVDSKGRVSLGENPTTLAGYGITNALNSLTGGSVSGNIILNSGAVLTGLLNPTAGADAANKAYVDAMIASLANGVSWRTAVQVATTANITLTGLQTIDGQVIAVGQRVLVKNQTAGTENGFYVAATGAWARATDADTGPELLNAATLVLKGTANGLTQWVNTNTGTITVGTTAVNFSQLQGASAAYIAGSGLALNGLTFSIAPTGVIAGTYNKLTVNALGQVTTGANLTATDLNTILGYTPYNGSINPLNFLTSVPATTYTGDVTGSGSGSVALSLAATGVTPGAYAKVTVDAKGRVTSGGTLLQSDVTTALGYTPYNGTTNPNGYIGNSSPITISGDAAGTGLSAITLTLATSGVTAGTYTKVTVDAKGRVTVGANLTNAEIVAAIGYTPVNKAGDTMAGALNYAPTVSIAAATTTAIAALTSNNIVITGSTTINGFDALPIGSVRNIRFNTALTLTHNGTSFQLPSAANIVTASGDYAQFTSIGASQWRCDFYQRISGEALVSSSGGSPFSTTQVFNGSTTQVAAKFKNIVEINKIVGTAIAAAQAVSISEGTVQLFTSAATANWVPNVRFDAATTLNTAIGVGESVTVTLLVTQGATAFFPTAFQVDGVSVVPKWLGGTAPASGNTTGIDAYTYVIIKTAASTYTVLASQAEFG